MPLRALVAFLQNFYSVFYIGVMVVCFNALTGFGCISTSRERLFQFDYFVVLMPLRALVVFLQCNLEGGVYKCLHLF